MLLFLMVYAPEHGVAEVHGNFDIARHGHGPSKHPRTHLHLPALRLLRTTMPNQIQFYFDCVSPWSYIAYNVVKRYEKVWNVQVDFLPRSLDYVMKFANNKPPVTVPNKGAHMFRELGCAERMFGTKVQFPSNFPFPTMLLMGFLRAAKEKEPGQFDKLLEASFNTIWRDGQPLQNAEQIQAMAESLFKGKESDLAQLLEFAGSRDGRHLLRGESEKLVEAGAFGFPWIVATREDGETMQVFGADRFELLAAFFHKSYLGPMANGETPRL